VKVGRGGKHDPRFPKRSGGEKKAGKKNRRKKGVFFLHVFIIMSARAGDREKRGKRGEGNRFIAPGRLSSA